MLDAPTALFRPPLPRGPIEKRPAGPTVLVVQRGTDLEMFLSNWGFDVTTFENGADALEACKESSAEIAAIVWDGEGEEASKQLRAIEKMHGIPVIYLSRDAASPFAMTLQKPIKPLALIAAIESGQKRRRTAG